MRKLPALPLLLIVFSGLFIASFFSSYTVPPVSTPATVPPSDTAIALDLVAEGFTNPISMKEAPDNSGRKFVVDQIGLIRIIDEAGNLREEPFLDIRDKMVQLKEKHDERGLLGIAFHPDFAENGRFFIHYSAPLRDEAPQEFDHTKHVSEFIVDPDDPNKADPGSERIILQVDEPETNHNGGTMAIGPEDGYLYLGLGDGGAANDTGVGHQPDWYEENEGGNGQNRTNLLGSIIRIDIDNGNPYSIPEDNPFADELDRAEIYAYGFRNPFKFSFDRGGDHALYVGDVGQKLWEEINIVEKGGNYGWNVKEGFMCFDAANAKDSLASCPDTAPNGDQLHDPILVFPHEEKPDYVPYGIAVIGGYVYRGEGMSNMQGKYFFATWTQEHEKLRGAIYTAEQAGDQWKVQPIGISNSEMGSLGRFLNSFAEDSNGELYVLTSENEAPVGNTGKIYRMTADSDYDYTVSDKYGHFEEHEHEH